MPIPKRKTGEKENKFVSRCMRDSNMKEYEHKQRLGICMSRTKNKTNSLNFPNIDIFSIKWNNPPEKPRISCCIEEGNRCIKTIPAICDLHDGNPVGSCEEMGSCCMQSGDCEEMTECECHNLRGDVCGGTCYWVEGHDCGQSNPCDF